MRSYFACLIFPLLLLTAGCNDLPISNGQPALGEQGIDPPGVIFGDLSLTLTLEPEVVRTGESVRVSLVIENRGERTVTLKEGCSLPALFEFRRNGRRAEPIIDLFCATVIRNFTLAPEEEIIVEHDFAFGTSGSYTAHVAWTVREPLLPPLEQPFEVR